jgi:hypothetical protein
MYLIDATVTNGMSGGPVHMTIGEGTAENALIGVNFGYWPIPPAELGVETPASPEERLIQLRAGIDRLNSQLALAVPIHHLANVLNGHPAWHRRASPD